jgi:hypothetical protein
MSEVDDMQNTALSAMDMRLSNLEKTHGELQVQFADLMGRLDIIIKGSKWLVGVVAVGVGIDVAPFMAGEI